MRPLQGTRYISLHVAWNHIDIIIAIINVASSQTGLT